MPEFLGPLQLGPLDLQNPRQLMNPDAESALQFPCRFPIKAMGRAECELVSLVTEVAARHDPHFEPGTVRSKDSSGGRYRSITITIHATSRAQLDAIYRELTAREEILMVL